jgi:hypothetical protein
MTAHSSERLAACWPSASARTLGRRSRRRELVSERDNLEWPASGSMAADDILTYGHD